MLFHVFFLLLLLFYFFFIFYLFILFFFSFFSIISSGGHSLQQSGIILAILVKSHKRNTSVKLLWNQAFGCGGRGL